VTEQASGPARPDTQIKAIETAEQLVAAREHRGMGKGEVAQRLKVHPRQVDALERGDWDALPGRAFARGCARSYGRLLGVDVEPLVRSIGGYAEPGALIPSATLAAPMPRRGGFGFDGEGKGSKWPWALLGVVGVIAVAMFFGRDGDVSKVGSWLNGGSSPPDIEVSGVPPSGTGGGAAAPPLLSPAPTTAATAPAGSPAAAGVPLPSGAAAVAAAAGSVPTGAPGQGATSTGVASASAVAPGAPAAAVVPPPPPPPPAPPPIRLTVRQDAWVDVRQADGRSVFVGTVRPSAPVDVKGEPPFSLTIGNASQVTLEFEGKPVDLKPLITSPNNIAKVRVP